MQFKCPTCRKEITVLDGEARPAEFPFCSDRCRMVDLGKWLSEEFYIPGEPARREEDDDDIY